MERSLPSSIRHTIPAVNHAIELVRLLAQNAGETTTKSLAYRLGVPRTTCYRILRSLEAQDWVRRTPDGEHELSLGLLPLLLPLRPVENLAERVQPALEQVAGLTGLTAKVTVRQGNAAVTVARCESPRETSVAVRMGASFHLAYGSSGAVLLSGLTKDQVRRILEDAPRECWSRQSPDDVQVRLQELARQGWCADFGNFRESCHAISTPVRDSRGRVLAAMTIIGFPHELTRERQREQVRRLLDAVREAQKALRGWETMSALGRERTP